MERVCKDFVSEYRTATKPDGNKNLSGFFYSLNVVEIIGNTIKHKEEYKMERQGSLFYDPASRRMDIRFGLESYYGGLHCGTGMDVLIDGKWVPTRIELSDDWYLVGIKTDKIEGLVVRI